MKEREKEYIVQITILTVVDFILSLGMVILNVLYVFTFCDGQSIGKLQIHGLLCVAVLLVIGAIRLKKAKLQKARIDYEESMEDTQ